MCRPPAGPQPGPGDRCDPKRALLSVSKNDNPRTRSDLHSIRRQLPPSSRTLLDAAIDSATGSAELWLVGGAMRDCAAGAPLRDVDLATAGDAAALARVVAARTGALAREWPRFDTAAVELGGQRLDIATLRTERYARPGALPAVRAGASIEADLARRDFTVSAVALGVAGPRAGELVDPFGGLDDLAQRRLRALHEGCFRDDATRLWRGARYAARLRLRPDAATERLITAGGRWLDRISARRLWMEFERTAAERRPAAALRLLDAWGVLHATQERFALSAPALRALRRRPGPLDAAVLLAVLLAPLPAEDAEAVTGRLGAPRAARGAVHQAAQLLALGDTTPEALAAVERSSDAARTAAAWLDPRRQRTVQAELRRWQRARPPLDAAELTRLGVEPGPAIGVWLRRLRRERFLGTLSGATEARRRVRRALLHNEPGGV